jgi:spermidine/putrescine transport system substrate-binding protein
MTKRLRPPLPPEAEAIIRMQRGLSRRSLMSGAGLVGLGSVLAACGTSGTTTGGGAQSTGKPSPAADKSDTDKVVNWANWTLYLDYDDKTKTYPTLVEFTKQTGIKATYAEDIEDNDTYYGKIQGQLKNGQDIGKDVITLTDWMAARIVRQGYVQKLDKANIPNWTNILDNLKNIDFDPGRNYSLTWQSGFTGIAWNKEKLKAATGKTELKTVSDLWDSGLKGRVEVLSEMRDTVGLIMLDQGVDPSKSFTADQYNKALAELEKQLNNGQIRQVKGNSYKEDLISEDALAVMAWSGDITQLNFENGNKWVFAIPEPGGMLWSDNLMIPIGSPHKKNAEILMNYYYDPKVAALVADYVNYICPVKGAKAEIEKIDPDLASNTSIFPDEATLSNVFAFRSLTPAEETAFNSDFQKVLGA